jgi:outer membrane protein
MSDISRVRALEQALISTRTAAEATQAGFEVGTRTSVDVLLALRETYRAERDYAGARYTYIQNTLRLKQAAGTLSREDLEAVNAWLQ